MALKVSRLGCDRHPTSGSVWELRLAKEVALADHITSGSSDPSGKGREKLMAAFKTALAHIPAEASPAVWLQVSLHARSCTRLQGAACHQQHCLVATPCRLKWRL